MISFNIFVCLLIVSTLISASVDEQFFSSCRVGDTQKVKAFLESGISVHSRDAKGNTCIIIASGRGKLEVINLLRLYGATEEDATSIGVFEGKTTLCWAASQGRTETVAALIQAGVDANKPPSAGIFAGKNALMWAASQGRTEVVRFLLSANAEVDFSSDSGNFKV
jgi:ankyrin repeat protein